MIPVGRGQRELVIGDRQTGKSTVCIDTILNQKDYDGGCVLYICCNWTKASTVAGIAKMLEEKAMAYTIIVAANASDPARCKFMLLSQVQQLENILEIQVVQL
jgi:F-type H+-transporting ATPase subunit alpha